MASFFNNISKINFYSSYGYCADEEQYNNLYIFILNDCSPSNS